MAPAIIAAIITGSISLIGIVVSTVISSQKHQEEQKKFVSDLFTKLDKQSELADTRLEAKLDRSQAVTDAKIDELTREVREHNNFARRVPILEERAKMADKRLDALEASERDRDKS